MPSATKMPSPPKGATRLSTLSVALLVLILVTAAILWAVSTLQKPSSSSATGESAASKDVQTLISDVSRHIVVKQDEQPTVATVQDADLLRKQNPEFYKDAQNGDRLLIWSDKAVLYSSSRDLILSVLPINLPVNAATSTNTTTTSQTSQQENATIEVRNGSGVAGQAGLLVTKLKGEGMTVLTPTDARVKTRYPKTLVVNASGKELPATLKALQSATGGQVSSAPAGEEPIKGDVLVIIGTDYTN